MTIFFKAADTLGSTLMQRIDEDRAHRRLRTALLHTLMYISDCYRYLLQHQKSKDAAELMRILAPGDAEAHMRVAINLAMLSEDDRDCSAFFHYCSFLANRNVSVDHREAVVVSRHVQNVRANNAVAKRDVSPTRFQFTSLFIETLWSILAEDFDTSCQKVKQDQLWKTFQGILGDGVSSRDLLLIVGCLIFVHHRISPQGNKEGKTLLQTDLTETIVCKVIGILAAQVSSCLRELNKTIRARKKNRRRAMQKKRRLDGAVVTGVAPEILGFEVLKSIADVDAHIPYLGALTFLAHYWSKARMAPSPSSDFNGMATALQSLHQVMQELLNFEKITCTSSLTGVIGSRIIADLSDAFPAMQEDIMFCNYNPCKQQSMFRNILIQEVPFPAIFGGQEQGLIKAALRNLGDSTFESLVNEPVRRHLEAFGQKCLKRSAIEFSMDKASSAALVSLTLRKFRINRLILGLEKVGGGKLSRMIAAGETNHAVEERSDDECEVEERPPLGQPPEGGQEDSLQQDLTSREIGFRLRKRRRLMGTSTPADVEPDVVMESNSNGSSKAHEDVRMTKPAQPQHDQGLRPAKRMKSVPSLTRTEMNSVRGGGFARRRTYLGGMLSQGTFQLTFTPPVEVGGEKSSRLPDRQPDHAAQLSQILRDVLYPTNLQIPSPPKNLTGPAFWRNCPSDDYIQVLPVNFVGSQ